MSVQDLLEYKKSPTSRRKYVGIEIEFLLAKGGYSKMEKLLIKNNLQWYVHLGGDGSVQDTEFVPEYAMRQNNWNNQMHQYITNEQDRKVGREIRILVEECEAANIITQCCDIIKQCRGIINETCGLHVHVDLRNRDYGKVYHNLFSVQGLMFLTQPASRRKNKFCRKLPRLLKGDDVDRYYAINKRAYKEHRTMEVRLHEPTLEAKDIIMWTKFLVKIADMNTMLDKKVTSVEELDCLPQNLKGYLNERIQKYA